MKIQHGIEIRDATNDEIAAYESSFFSDANARQNASNFADARNSAISKLAQFGLTEAEIKALVGQ